MRNIQEYRSDIGDLHRTDGGFGLCFGILKERRPHRGRKEGVVKYFEKGGFEKVNSASNVQETALIVTVI